MTPYIPEDRRDEAEHWPNTPGELNYALCCMADWYITRKGLSYNTLSEVVGALECAKLEMYRRIAAPYEDEKIKANGEVFTVIPD